VSNSAGGLGNTYGYSSFGTLTASTGTLSSPFRYTGREFDVDTGLYYYRTRYYDTTTGRFLAEDALRFVAGLDFYTYVVNSPPNFTDPLGTQEVQDAPPIGPEQPPAPPIPFPWPFFPFSEPAEGPTPGDPLPAPPPTATVPTWWPGSGPGSGSVASASQRQHEYDLMKQFCDSPAPAGSNPCSTLSKQIDHALKCIALYEAWDAKWLPDRHKTKILEWKQRLQNLKDEYTKKCTNKCP
jgi:type VI secretion system secreted protein VgrG